MTTQVLRRFEVQGLSREKLEDVTNVLGAAEQQGQVTLIERTAVELPLSLKVRLQGTARDVSDVIKRITDKGGRIYRDFVDVPAGTPRERPYPDPKPLLRMGGGNPYSPPHGPLVVNAPTSVPVTIAIVDSGIMVNHPDLRRNLWEGGHGINGARCANGKVVDHDLTDEDGHGTMLAGTILATANFEPSIKLMAVKFFDGATRPSAANAAAAIHFAVDHGADIIHLSWELGIPSGDVQQAIGEAYNAGCLVVFAAGNEGANADKDDIKIKATPATPSRYASDCREQALVVMATDWYDNKAWFSSYGKTSVDIAAPGVDIVTTCPFVSTASQTSDQLPGRYRTYSGTSAASAHVTGAAALVKSRYPGLGAADLKAALFESADHPPDLKGRCRSEGRLKIA
jgi:subtilisin family serine protease